MRLTPGSSCPPNQRSGRVGRSSRSGGYSAQPFTFAVITRSSSAASNQRALNLIDAEFFLVRNHILHPVIPHGRSANAGATRHAADAIR
jgi:hypothetical protein